MRITRSVLGAATVVAMTLGAAACGDDGSRAFTDQTAADIKADVISDMQDLTSMAIVAEISSGGQEIGLDLSLDDEGQCTGTIGISDGSAELLSVDGETFVRGDEAFWETAGGSSMMGVVGDKWAKMPAGTAGFGSFCDLDGLLDEFGDTSGDKPVTKGETGDVDGQAAISLVTDEDPGTTTVWVATSDEGHYILKIDRAGGTDTGSITLGSFNEPLELTAPGEGDFVDLGAVG